MSKVDALRAMREARYAAFEAQTAAARKAAAGRSVAVPAQATEPPASRSSAGRRATAVVPADSATKPAAGPATKPGGGAAAKPAGRAAAESAMKPAPKSATRAAADAGPESDRLCGHRSIGSKSCQRPAGHPEKNHRYK